MAARSAWLVLSGMLLAACGPATGGLSSFDTGEPDVVGVDLQHVAEAVADAVTPDLTVPEGDADAAADPGSPEDADGTEATDRVEPDEIAGEPRVRCTVTTAWGELAADELVLGWGDEPLAYADSPGLQVDVVARFENVEPGRPATLLVGGVEVGTQAVGVNEATGEPEVVFAAVTLPPGDGLLVEVAVVDPAGSGASCSKTVTVDTGACTVSLAPLPTGDACVLADAYAAEPGFQMMFTISNPSRDCSLARLSLSIDGSEAVLSPPVLFDDDGNALVLATVSEAETGLNGLRVEVIALAESPEHPALAGSTPASTWYVDTDVPVVTVGHPAPGTLDLSADVDGDPANGLQIDVTGSVSGLNPGMPGDRLRLTTTSGAALELVDPSVEFSFDGVGFPADGAEAIKLVATDACGRTGQAEVALELYTRLPALELVAPAEGSVLLARDDGNPATPEYETDAVVQVAGLPAGRSVIVRCGPVASTTAPVEVGRVLRAEGAAAVETVPVVLDPAVLSSAVTCVATHDYPNPSESAPRAFTLALPAPSLQLTKPAGGLVTRLGTLVVEGTAHHFDDLPLDAVVRAASGGELILEARAFASVHDGAVSGAVDIASLADGPHMLAVDGADAFGNVLSEQPGTDATRTFVVDRSAPEVSPAQPADLRFDEVASPDVDPHTPGYQGALTFDVFEANWAPALVVCLTVNGGATACQGAVPHVPADGHGGVTFAGLSFLPGDNVVVVTSTDAAGNASSVTRTVVLVSDRARLEMVQPAHDVTVAQPEQAVIVRLSDADTATALAGADVVLMHDGLDEGPMADLGGGIYALPVVLSEGPNRLQARACVAGLDTFSEVRIVTWKTAAPTVALVAPVDGAVIGADDPSCAAGSLACVRDVRAATTNVDDGSLGTLSVLCGGDPSSYPAVAAAGALVFSGVVLADQSACLLVVDVVDAAGAHATGAPVTVRVDRVRPRLVSHDLPAFVLKRDDLEAASGVQVDVTLTVAGLEAGRELALSVTPAGLPVETLRLTNAADVADDVPVTRVFRVSLPAGAVTLRFAATDAAGNAAEPLAGSAWVVDAAPLVGLTAPAFVADRACAADGECSPGLCLDGRCWWPWARDDARAVEGLAQGIVTAPSVALNLRVCSDGAPADAPPCTTAGYGVVASGRVDGYTFALPLATLSDGRHQLTVEGLADPLHDEWVSSLSEGPWVDRRFRRVLLDTAAPVVSGLDVASDTLAPPGVLNRAERSPDGTFTVRVTGSEDGSAQLLVGGVQAAEAPLVAGLATFAVALDEGASLLQARLVDRVGNAGETGPVPGVPATVDTVPPVLAFESPAKAVLAAADSADVVVSADAAGLPVAIFDGVFPLGVGVTDANGRAVFVGALLADGTYDLRAEATDAAQNASGAAPAFGPVLVDRTPPTLTVQAPADLATLADAGPDQPGFQVAVTAGTDDAVLWSLSLARGCSATYEGCAAPVPVFIGPITAPGALEPAVELTVPGASTRRYVLTVEARDAHGNTARVQRSFAVDVAGCQVTLENFPDSGYLGNARCTPAGQDCAGVGVAWVASYLGDCGAITALRLLENGVTMASVAPVDGKVTFASRSYSNGRALNLEARAIAGAAAAGTTGPLSLVVDLADPVVAFVATTLNGFSTPPSGAAAVFGLAADHDPVAPDVQIPVVVRVTDAHADGGLLDRFEAWSGASVQPLAVQSPTLPMVLGPSPATTTVEGLTLASGETHVKVFARDEAGNEASAGFTASVDLVPPGPVMLAPLQADEIERRLPRVVLRWTAPGDDGGQGAATAYDVRFSRRPILDEASFEAACPVDDVTSVQPVLVPAAAGQPEAFEVAGPDVRPEPNELDPERCKLGVGGGDVAYRFAVRAIDEAGNRSPVMAAGVVTTDALNLKTARVSFSGALQEPGMNWQFTPLGDVNGDGLADFATYSDVLAKACVVLGRSDGTAALDVPGMDLSTGLSATHRCFAAGAGATSVGAYTAGLGDVDGDGVGDWAMGYGGTSERVDVFLGLGEPAAPGEPPIAASPFLRVTGQSYGSPAATSQVFRVGDFDGDGLADLGVGSRLTNVFYLLLLDPTFTAGPDPRWSPGEPPLALTVTQPATYGAVRVVRVRLTGWTDPASYFGANAAAAGNLLREAGDDATPPEEVVLYQQASPNQVFVLKGRAVPSSVDLYLSAAHNGTAANNLEVVRLWRESGATEGQFGLELSGGVDLNGGGVPDLVIGHPMQAQAHPELPYGVYVVYGETLQGELGVRLNGVKLSSPTPAETGDGVLAGQYGVILQGTYRRPGVLGDFDGAPDGAPDLVLQDASQSPGGAFWIRLNGAVPTASIPRGTFPYVDVTVRSPYPEEPPAAFADTVFPLSDFNGDGFPDILVGVKGGGFPTVVY